MLKFQSCLNGIFTIKKKNPNSTDQREQQTYEWSRFTYVAKYVKILIEILAVQEKMSRVFHIKHRVLGGKWKPDLSSYV